MSPRAFARDVLFEMLGGHPARIDELMRVAPAERRRTRPRPDAWSAEEIFAHVRACADVWGGHIATILDEHPTRIPAGDPRAWAVDHGYLEAEFASSFAAYARDRAALLDRLGSLSDGDWSSSALMVGSASRVDRSVQWHADHIARHEEQHVLEIRRTLRTVARSS